MSREQEEFARELMGRFHFGGGHSPYQLDRFVIAQNGITLWGSFRQILREIDSRLAGIEDVRASLVRSYLFRPFSFAYRRRLRAQGRRLRTELSHFYQRISTVYADLGELSPERIEELEADYFFRRLQLLMRTELAASSYGQLSPGVVEAIAFLPERDRERLLVEIDELRQRPISALDRLSSFDNAPQIEGKR